MIRSNNRLAPPDLLNKIQRLWELSASKIKAVESSFDFATGSPVYTVQGRYGTVGWTEWTLGFHFGSALLQYDATLEPDFLELGRAGTVARMESHLTHTGVHDHGFNNVSTFGNLRRLLLEGRLQAEPWEKDYYELALKCSAAVQAARWTQHQTGGFVYSFNGPHSLFADTIRSLRALALGYLLGHSLMEENDRAVSLLERLVEHARSTARYSVYYGHDRDHYDVRGRVAHESIFNINDGRYRCPNSQQGFSPRSTWTRGLAWIVLGFAEQLEFFKCLPDEDLEPCGGRAEIESFMLEAAKAAADFYLDNSPTNGIPYWDTGAPGLERIDNYLEMPADPFNDHEPVDSSAASITAQGLLRLGNYLKNSGEESQAATYWQAGLTIADSLFDSPYLSVDTNHQGLILHSVYHRPNGWDYVPAGRKVPCGESSMWGDYHARELALYIQRIAKGETYLTFWSGEELTS
jgi:hypothetical protein